MHSAAQHLRHTNPNHWDSDCILFNFLENDHLLETESRRQSTVPETWDMTQMDKGYSKVVVDETDDSEEYKLVSAAFYKTSGDGVKIREVSLPLLAFIDEILRFGSSQMKYIVWGLNTL